MVGRGEFWFCEGYEEDGGGYDGEVKLEVGGWLRDCFVGEGKEGEGDDGE